MKKKIALTLAIVLILTAVPMVASAAAAKWTARQEQAHALADNARAMGYGEESAAIKVMQDIFALEGGDASVMDSYYYSGRTKQYYKLNVAGNTVVVNSDGSYFDGTYYWYLDEKTGYYYRYDKNGKRINGEKRTDPYGSYNGYNLWNGLITGVDRYISTSEAETVAKFILSYQDMTDGSTRQKAEIAWIFLNCKEINGNSISNTLARFGEYNSKANLQTQNGKDALAIAKDVLYRYYVENRSNINVGRVLPSNYYYMWIQSGKVYLQQVENGTYWDHSSASPY